MTPPLTLYYAPDNASLCVRLALLAMDLPFDTVLVDRSTNAQTAPAYLAINPSGLIPTLVTPNGPVHETAAILLWLADQHQGSVFPAPDSPARGTALSWLFWLSNTLHPALRMKFYPAKYIRPEAHSDLHAVTADNLCRFFAHLDVNAAWLDDRTPSVLACYLAPMIRWTVLYGGGASWFEINKYPRLHGFAQWFENTDIAAQASLAEGLGKTIFSAPSLPNPPEGSAI